MTSNIRRGGVSVKRAKEKAKRHHEEGGALRSHGTHSRATAQPYQPVGEIGDPQIEQLRKRRLCGMHYARLVEEAVRDAREIES